MELDDRRKIFPRNAESCGGVAMKIILIISGVAVLVLAVLVLRFFSKPDNWR